VFIKQLQFEFGSLGFGLVNVLLLRLTCWSPEPSSEFGSLPIAPDPPDLPGEEGRMYALRPDMLTTTRIVRPAMTDYEILSGSAWRNRLQEYWYLFNVVHNVWCCQWYSEFL